MFANCICTNWKGVFSDLFCLVLITQHDQRVWCHSFYHIGTHIGTYFYNSLLSPYSYTFEMMQQNTDNIWRFMQLQVVMDYSQRPVLPPPLIFVSHLRFLAQALYRQKRCCPRGSVRPKTAFRKLTIELVFGLRLDKIVVIFVSVVHPVILYREQNSWSWSAEMA